MGRGGGWENEGGKSAYGRMEPKEDREAEGRKGEEREITPPRSFLKVGAYGRGTKSF